ncbi:MAG: hypothetical protein WCK05_01460, partial [Planctomycetota bacterium]
MTRRTTWLATVATLAMAGGFAPAPAGQEARLPLQLELGLKVLTPTRLAGGAKMMAFKEANGKVDLGFGDVTVVVVSVGRAFRIDIDLDGDGRISRQEQIPIAPNGVAALTFARPGDDTKATYRVLFTHVEVGADHGVIHGISAQCHPDYAWRATLGKTTVRLIDANLDGKLTQDGADAIAIGPVALPLLKRHNIGGTEYDLTVSPDGQTLTAVDLGDREHAKVTLPFRSPALKHLILKSATQAYDIVACPMIPPDTYSLAMGMLVQGGETVVIAPGPETVSYPIKGDFVNLIKIGPPLSVTFTGSSEKKGPLTVRPPSAILGSGGERYLVQYPVAAWPTVTVLAGGRTITSGPMPHDKDNHLTAFTDRFAGLIDTWKVEVRVPIPGLTAPAIGSKTIAELPVDLRP